MRRTRRSFTAEYRFSAAHRVIDGMERVADVARELDLHESVLHTWVRDERWRMTGAGPGGGRPDPGGGQPLLAMELLAQEHAELVRLRAKMAEQAEAIASLKRALSYLAAQLNRPEFPECLRSPCDDARRRERGDQVVGVRGDR
ncbi:transposase [Mycobacterium intracellulare]|uniref:transposase n=1 Tax=Mycobacterium intracellulare TaxID=1767 RepID=UPI001F52A565|nr:transposase [Mycobacterium intracellulare]